MKEYTKAKIAAEIELDLLQFLDDDVLKADVLNYLRAPHIELKNQVLMQYEVPVSDDTSIRAIRKLFADDFLSKYPQHAEQLGRIYDKYYIAIEEQIAYLITYKIEGYTKTEYEAQVPGSDEVYAERKTYLQALASAVAGTPNAERLHQDDVATVIDSIALTHLNGLKKLGIEPSRDLADVSASIIDDVRPSIERRDDNNYSLLFNTTSALSGLMSASAFTVVVLALESFITISTAGIGLLATFGVASALTSLGVTGIAHP